MIWNIIWGLGGFSIGLLIGIILLESLTFKYKTVVRQAYQAGLNGQPITAVFEMRGEQ